MATLALTSWHIDNVETGQVVANNVDPKLRKPAFGDLYEGYFTYTLTDLTISNSTEIRFNPGLFVRDGFEDTSNLGSGAEQYSLLGVRLTTAFQDLRYSGPTVAFDTGRNETYQIRKINSTSFEIKMSFYMTADTQAYLGAVSQGQRSRLTADIFAQNPSNTFTNNNNSIYTQNATLDVWTLGLYCSVIYNQSPVAQVVLSSTGTPGPTAAFELNAGVGTGIDFLADGWDNPCGTGSTDVEIVIYRNGTVGGQTFTFQGVLVPGSTSATQLVFSSSVDFPVALDGGTYVMELTAIECGDSFLYGEFGDSAARLREWDFLDIDGLFVNDGIHTDREFLLLRSGNSVSTINTTNPTDVQFNFTYTGSDVTKAKYWFIPTNVQNNATDWWFDALRRTPIQFTDLPAPINISGNDWRVEFSIDPGTYNLNVGETYHILYVLYDDTDNYYASYVFQNIRVSDEIEVPDDGTYCIIPIEGEVGTYKDNFTTDYLKVSPLQRVYAKIALDKDSYNACSNINRLTSIVATLEKSNGQILATTTATVLSGVVSSTSGDLLVSDNISSASLIWVFRIEDIYTNQEITVRWKINSLTEPTETFFLQKFKVDDYQQNLPPSDQDLTQIDFQDEAGVIITPNDTNCNGDDLTVITTKDPASPDYSQVAVWLDSDLRVEEHDFFIPGTAFIPQLTTTFQFDGEQKFSTTGDANQVRHKITSSVNENEVGIIGYPPPLPTNFARVMLHHTNPNGRNIVFVAQEDINPGTKFLFSLGGLTTSNDYTFRIGDNTAALVDANDSGWGAFPSVPWATFVGSTIPSGSRIRVEYIGAATQTDLPAFIDYVTDQPIVYPRVLTKPNLLSANLAANDFMLYTGVDTSFLAVTTPATVRYSEKRSIAEIVASSNLTDYVNGDTYWGIFPNATTGNHLHLEPTSAGGFNGPSITVSTISSNLQLSTYATPLSNKYYPTSGVGINPPALRFDRVNDFVSYISTVLDWETIPNDSYIYVRSIFNQQASSTGGVFPRLFIANNFSVANDGFVTMTGGGLVYLIPDQRGINFNNQVTSINIVLRKKGNTGTANDLFYLDDCFTVRNSFHRSYSIFTDTSITPVGNGEILLGSVNKTGVSNNAIHKLGFSISATPPTIEECHRYCRGEALPPLQYEWDFTTTAAGGTELTAIGSAGHANANLDGGPTIGTLFT